MQWNRFTPLFVAAAVLLPAAMPAQSTMDMPMPSTNSTTTPSRNMVSPATVFDKLLSNAEKDFVGAASAMPAEKFNFAPTNTMGKYDGVRTFSAEIKHVIEANYAYFGSLKLPHAKTRTQIETLTGRDAILQALKDSFTYLHAGIATMTAANAFAQLSPDGDTRAGLAAGVVVHMNDHYGQMVEYLRMNRVVPPASLK